MDNTAPFFQWLVANAGSILAIGASVIGTFAMIATLTPNSSDNTIADFLLKLINALGANVGKAKNDPSVK